MKNQKKKLLQRRRTQILSGVAFLISICANIMMFCILAIARTTPAVIHQQENESIHIVSLDLPVPTNIEKDIQQKTIVIVELDPETAEKEPFQSPSEMVSFIFPNIEERIQDISFNLPGLPINTYNIPPLIPVLDTNNGNITKPFSTSSVDILPSKISGPIPRYPQWARRNKLNAVVTLRFIVTAEGTVKNISIREIEGDERFGREAIQAVSQWRFKPAIKTGKPVSCWCIQKINFKFSH